MQNCVKGFGAPLTWSSLHSSNNKRAAPILPLIMRKTGGLRCWDCDDMPLGNKGGGPHPPRFKNLEPKWLWLHAMSDLALCAA